MVLTMVTIIITKGKINYVPNCLNIPIDKKKFKAKTLINKPIILTI